MQTANTLDEARDFFLSNSSGNITCIKGTRQKECTSFPEAENFYNDRECDLCHRTVSELFEAEYCQCDFYQEEVERPRYKYLSENFDDMDRI